MSTQPVLNHSSLPLNRKKPQPNFPALKRSQSLLQTPSTDRRQMLLAEQELWSSSSTAHARSNSNVRFDEIAGGATAGIAAVACCAPISIADLLLLVVYRVPTGLCRKALREKRRRRLMKKGSLLLTPKGHDNTCDCSYCNGIESEFQTGNPMIMAEAMEKDEDIMQLEKEMWDKFYGAGFWRTNSSKAVSAL